MFRTKSNGFSLVELMIVVAIMAILAAIAIPSFMRFSLRAKTAEANMNLAAIRTCLETYRAENDKYISCVDNPGTWSPGDGACEPKAWQMGLAGWTDIGFQPDGNVRYKYNVAATATTFIITATGDLDEDSDPATFTVDTEALTYPKAIKGGTGDY